MKRRTFLKAGMIGGGATALINLPACTSLSTSSDRSPASNGKFVVRRELSDPLAKKDIETYQRGVEILRKNPALVTNSLGQQAPSGLNFANQADIHQNFCPHGTWKFFPWHREYLFRYEEIIRAVTGDETFALPYWDWSKTPKLPDAFRVPTSSLYINEETRLRDFSGQISAVCHPDRIKAMEATKEFESFMGSPQGGGPVEYGPHNTIHVAVGGTMATFKSPNDPVFWVHHCNVDRLWAEWQESNDFFQKEAPIPNYNEWLELELDGFYDRKGVRLSPARKAKDVIDPKDLGYLYDTSKRLTVAKTVNKTPRPFSRRTIAQTDPLDATVEFRNKQSGTLLITLPDLPEEMLLVFNSYLENPYDYKDYLVNLKMTQVPDLPAGTRMVVQLLVDSQQTFVLNYTPFKDPTNPHAAHKERGTLNIDYGKVLDTVFLNHHGQYPRKTQFIVNFSKKDGSPLVVKDLDTVKMKYILTLYGPQQSK